MTVDESCDFTGETRSSSYSILRMKMLLLPKFYFYAVPTLEFVYVQTYISHTHTLSAHNIYNVIYTYII